MRCGDAPKWWAVNPRGRRRREDGLDLDWGVDDGGREVVTQVEHFGVAVYPAGCVVEVVCLGHFGGSGVFDFVREWTLHLVVID